MTHENLPTLHRYFRLRAHMLGIEDLQYYDMYPDLVHMNRHFTVQEAMHLTQSAVGVLGPDYTDKLAQGFSERWMHVFPAKGKDSGAYMNGSAYDAHPYILLNFNGDYDSVSTFAHEWGHAVHTLLTNEHQPFHMAEYSTFVAETASVMNEVLLQEYMLEHASSKQEKLYYLGTALEQIRTTFFRQTMFSEFEETIHAAAQTGEPLSGERLSEIYGELLEQYHGHDLGVVTIDDIYTNEWMFVPHFYYDFYVFQYATAHAGATWFADRILAGDEDVREKYITMLSAGGSDYAYNLFKQAGLDMAAPEPYLALVARMNHLMDEIEKLLDE